MNIPPSDHFRPLSLADVFNINRQDLSAPLTPLADTTLAFGAQSFHGIPFELGAPDQANLILLDQDEVQIEVANIQANYIIFLHVVEDRPNDLHESMADFKGNAGQDNNGNQLGQTVSEYTLVYEDGGTDTVPILRRFAIQQSDINWGASPFAAVPFLKHKPFRSNTEAHQLERMPHIYGRGETRVASARDSTPDKLWLYALPNPQPDKAIRQIICTPKEERSLIYAISATNVTDHPLRPSIRQKLCLTLPEGVDLNAIGELDGIDIDLGQIISARARLDYDRDRWAGAEADVQPGHSRRQVVVEYMAHPQAKLYLDTGDGGTGDGDQISYDLANLPSSEVIAAINPAHRPVTIRVIDKETQRPVSVRFHLHGQFGEYLPPKGYHRQVNGHWFEDNYGEFVNSLNQYCYILGECVADLPLGEVFIEITRGYEVSPVRTNFRVTPETDEITFEIERVLDWRDRGWVTADTHVHFLSPQTALLEGAGEGVNVVNLLTSQWGEMFSNVSDFDGKTTFGATDFGGDGEFLVRVGTENRMQVLGHISLLGYSGAMIHPLCSGGPSESALGDAQEVTMADWAQRCIDQGGLVVMPHAPNPQNERAADIVLGLVHAIEMMTFNPFDAQISPYGIADWYRFLNLGYHLPVVGGSDKMAASSLLGGVRTYTNMADEPFTYQNWMDATQAGNTFVTVGPLAEMTVEGLSPGSRLELPATGGTINVSWNVESVSMPLDRVEIVVGGLTVEQSNIDKQLSAEGSAEITISDSTWVALRVRGSYHGRHGEIAAHTSAVQVGVEGKPLFSQSDAIAVLEQIEGAMAYVDTIAPRPDALRYKQLRTTLEAAHNRLHQRMHQNGIYHQHTPLHDHASSREH